MTKTLKRMTTKKKKLHQATTRLLMTLKMKKPLIRLINLAQLQPQKRIKLVLRYLRLLLKRPMVPKLRTKSRWMVLLNVSTGRWLIL